MSTWKTRLPMQITLLRIVLTIPIVAALWPNTLAWNMVAAGLFILASVSDYYDGYFARKYNAVSTMGKFMDPVADKILVTSVLTLLILPGKVDPFLVILLTARDTWIGAIRAVAAADGVIIAARQAGKWKTALQMAGIPAVILWDLPFLPGGGAWLGPLGYALLWFSTILSIASGLEYHRAYLAGRQKVA
ncbi:MAG: CDP-diacylglycerol--glycerol-3-phosphate 3-phosphatidyltransferase [Bdellovibrionaceae bacterium]|nr:CDP-diacylglycerol--glycerol-3-phosphate 3-phosphatidyltransferase [Pseudobdellovibrionaceae bacterium]MBX3034987.1 CDP-diacylglycerol--glycerol-3-phosphate 3-phosphatidyltransferase [Pseudobdellovibrionaceae bacterium]